MTWISRALVLAAAVFASPAQAEDSAELVGRRS